MKTGICPKCHSTDVYRKTDHNDECGIGYLPATSRWWGLHIDIYTCLTCGFIETYLPATRSDEDIKEIAQDWEKVPSQFSVGTATTRLPPLHLDGMVVYFYGPLNERVQPTGRLKLYYEDGTLFQPPYVAVCHNVNDQRYYRCYCDDSWQVVSKKSFSSVDEAYVAIEREYKGATTLLQRITP